VFVGGETDSADFPRVAAAQASRGGATDGFITRLNAQGNAIAYSTFLGGYANDRATAVAAGHDGSLYAAGSTASPNFPTLRALQSGLRGVQDAFVVKIRPSGALDYSTYLGGSGGTAPLLEGANGIAVDGAGNAYVAGTTNSVDFPVVGAYQGQLKGSADGFVSQISADGATVAYSTYLGGRGVESATAIAVDAGGAIHLAGYTDSSDFPAASSAQPCRGGGTDAFEATLSAGGASLRASTYIGGNDSDAAAAITVRGGSVYAAGLTQSWDFPLSSGMIGAAGLNAFLVRIDGAATRTAVRGDFDSNGTPDILRQKNATGEASVNYLEGADGSSVQSSYWIYPDPVPGWHIVGANDFNGDGKPDVLWQNDFTRQVIINYLTGERGNTVQSWAWMYADSVSGWTIAGTADLNGDGTPDVFWQNDSTRQIIVNYMTGAQGTTVKSSAFLYPEPVVGWKIAAIADFNRDNKPDVLWQNDTTRQVIINYLAGTDGRTVQNWSFMYPDPVPGWTLAGALDLNRDGTPDVLWVNDSSGQVIVNYMTGPSGATVQSFKYLYESDAPGWRVIPGAK
jgi:hypothetical protein